jgi:hypothetical protein
VNSVKRSATAGQQSPFSVQSAAANALRVLEYRAMSIAVRPAEARALFALSGVTHSKVADVSVGHLMLCESYSAEGPNLALRVQDVEVDMPAQGHCILTLRTLTNWSGAGAAIQVHDATAACVDLGVPTFVVNANSIGEALAKRTYDATPGMLALWGSTLIMLAAYGPYATQRAWWDVKTGKRVSGDGRLLLASWCVGLLNIDGIFVAQLRYPEDFKRE